jgi:hypothetical protein
MPQEGQACSNCFYARVDVFTRMSGSSGSAPVAYESLACHFWPPEPTLGTWRQIKPEDWCGQWSSDGAVKFGQNPALPPVVVPSPIVNVHAAEPLVLPAPAVNVAAAEVMVPAPVVNVNAPIGPTPEFEIGVVTTVLPGQPAAVRKRGTPENIILDFDIPKGNPGANP